jgi:hypothetical protein
MLSGRAELAPRVQQMLKDGQTVPMRDVIQRVTGLSIPTTPCFRWRLLRDVSGGRKITRTRRLDSRARVHRESHQ